jgi:hypothetical protein
MLWPTAVTLAAKRSWRRRSGHYSHVAKTDDTSFGPAHVVGVLSLVVLEAAIVALYFFRLAGPWRWIYIVGAVLALYLNVFVAVVQAFQKLPPLAALAPTQSEPPFLIAQLVVMAIFIVLGVVAVKRFHA